MSLTPVLAVLCGSLAAGNLFEMQPETHTRWSSFENPLGEKGRGGMANQGGKGAAFSPVAAGETVTLMRVEGQSGVVRRMWFTLRDRSPQALRSYVLRFYWDSEEKPAVEVPFGDFFGAVHGKTTAYETELFSSPEGRSFNCFIPMPFRKGARVTFTNESGEPLEQLFYDIDYTLEPVSENALYFHACWRRERWTTLGEDFEILPKVNGAGRFLGCNIGVIEHPDNRGWWGEGEVKMYVDGDTDWPTIVGTGTEDYIGTAYGQGVYTHRYQGCWFMDTGARMYAFYRYHVPDPVFFHQDIRVAIQQMGGADKKQVEQLVNEGAEIQPVSIHDESGFTPLLEMEPYPDIRDEDLPGGWTNMYRRDDVCATALLYLDKAANGLAPLAPVEQRVEALGG